MIVPPCCCFQFFFLIISQQRRKSNFFMHKKLRIPHPLDNPELSPYNHLAVVQIGRTFLFPLFRCCIVQPADCPASCFPYVFLHLITYAIASCKIEHIFGFMTNLKELHCAVSGLSVRGHKSDF